MPPPDTESDFLDDPTVAPASWPPDVNEGPDDVLPDMRGEQLKRTSDAIGRTLHDIQTGPSYGDFPTVERIMRRHRHQRRSRQLEDIAPKTGPMIQDIWPSIPERLYGVERDIHYLRRDIKEHRDDSIRTSALTASKQELLDLKASLTTDIMVIGRRLDSRVVWTVLQTVALIISSAYALIVTYQHFINKF